METSTTTKVSTKSPADTSTTLHSDEGEGPNTSERRVTFTERRKSKGSSSHTDDTGDDATKNRLDTMESRLGSMEAMLHKLLQSLNDRHLQKTPLGDVMNHPSRTDNVSKQEDAFANLKRPSTSVMTPSPGLDDFTRVLAPDMPSTGDTLVFPSTYNRLVGATYAPGAPDSKHRAGDTFSDPVIDNSTLRSHFNASDTLTTTQKPRIPMKFPKFRGKEGLVDAEEFLHRFTRISRAGGLQTQHYFDALVTCLTERDANWIEHWVYQRPGVTWNEIQHEFLTHFKSVNCKTEWLNRLRRTEMKTSVQGYTDEVLELMHKLGWDTSSEEALTQYKQGLPRWMLLHVANLEQNYDFLEGLERKPPPITVETMAKFMLRLEANDKLKTGGDRHTESRREGGDKHKESHREGGGDKHRDWHRGSDRHYESRRDERRDERRDDRPSFAIPSCNKCGLNGHLSSKCRVTATTATTANNKQNPSIKRMEVIPGLQDIDDICDCRDYDDEDEKITEPSWF